MIVMSLHVDANQTMTGHYYFYCRLYPKKLSLSSLTHHAAPGRVIYSEAVSGKFVEAQVGNSYGPT